MVTRVNRKSSPGLSLHPQCDWTYILGEILLTHGGRLPKTGLSANEFTLPAADLKLAVPTWLCRYVPIPIPINFVWTNKQTVMTFSTAIEWSHYSTLSLSIRTFAMMTCPTSNSQEVDQSSFWGSNHINWDAHRIGWAIAGGCAVLTVLLSAINVLMHCRNYRKPREQRQILRILYMPPVYAIVSFFSYRFFRSYTYYSLAEAAYEAVTISAFFLLLIEYVASTASDKAPESAMARKGARPYPIPFCCCQYLPSNPAFLYTLKWSVLQYVIIRPAASIAGVITQKYGLLCESSGFNVHFANVYLQAIDFASISIALYGLVLFYALTKDELAGRRPLAKFLSIKLIVMFTFYQSFLFSILEKRVIHATKYWTATNIGNGLNALTICIEMVFFAALMLLAYPSSEYKAEGAPATRIWRPLWDSINIYDFIMEIALSLKFFVDYMRHKPSTRSHFMDTEGHRQVSFGQAFGADVYTAKDEEHHLKEIEA